MTLKQNTQPLSQKEDSRQTPEKSTNPGDKVGINCCNSPSFCFVFFFVNSRHKTNTAIFPALYFYASAQGYSEVKYK